MAIPEDRCYFGGFSDCVHGDNVSDECMSHTESQKCIEIAPFLFLSVLSPVSSEASENCCSTSPPVDSCSPVE